MTFSRPTPAELIARDRADVDGRLAGADSRLRRAVLDVLLRVHTGALDAAYGYLGEIALDLMPDTAESDHLHRWMSIWGVPLKSAAVAGGPIVASGLNGGLIPANSILSRLDGVEYLTGAAVEVSGGTASLTVTAIEAGTAGNCEAGTLLRFASPSVGVLASATVGDGGIAGGLDDEDDTLALGRLLARIQQPPQGGAASDYLAWALAQPEVTRAWVFPGWTGAGSVGVAVVMDGRDTIVPTDGDLDDIAAAIDLLRPVTATVTVFAPTPYPTDYRLRLVPDNAGTRAAVQAELADLYAREAVPGGTMLISHIREAIAVAAAVTDYDLQVPGGNISSPPGAMPTLGNFTWL